MLPPSPARLSPCLSVLLPADASQPRATSHREPASPSSAEAVNDAFQSVRGRLEQLEADTLTGVNNNVYSSLGDLAFINSAVAANISAATGLNVSDLASVNIKTLSADVVSRYWNAEPSKAALRAAAAAVAPSPGSLYAAISARMAALLNQNATSLPDRPVVRTGPLPGSRPCCFCFCISP